MHVPDGFLTPGVWVSLDAAGAGLVAYGARRVSRQMQDRAIPLMGVLAAFVFAAQLISVPVAGGASAHFLGGALVGILAGPWSGLLVMTSVLAVQALLFQDGGVAALGANLFNMAFIGSTLSAWIYQGLRRWQPGVGIFQAGLITAWLSSVLAALATAAELSISGTVSWKISLPVMGGVQALFGIVEGLVTGTVLESVLRRRPDLLEREKI